MKPSIRFNGFRDEWVEKKLGEILKEGGSGGTPSSSKSEYYDGEIPFLSISDLSKSDVYVNETLKSITELGLNNSSAWVVPKNAISLAMYASVGKVGILSKPMATSQAFYNMVFDSIETGMFVYQWLMNRYIMNGWRKDISTGTQPNLNAQIVKSTVIQLPTPPEQQKIGALFSKYDTIIALREQKLAELNALKKGMLQQMFPKNGEKVPELRFAGFADDWEERKLKDISDYRNGKAHEQVEDEQGKFTIINSKFVSTDGKVKRNTCMQVEPMFKGELAVVLSDLPNGKALAKVFLVDENDKYTLNQRIAGINPNEGVNSIFLKYRMNRHSYFLKFDSGVSQTNLSKSQVEEFTTLYPSLKEQQKIGQLFKHLDARISNEQNRIQQLKSQKQGLLQRVL